MQIVLAGQTLPQAPQLELSLLMQVPPQSSNPELQLQLPALQPPPPQRLSQAPQLSALVLRLTQTPLQSFCPGGQAQLPALQTAPPVQRLPQAPQLVGSVLVSTQAPLQAVAPAGQLVTHDEAEQSWLILHVPAQLPAQLLPLSQTQLPALQ